MRKTRVQTCSVLEVELDALGACCEADDVALQRRRRVLDGGCALHKGQQRARLACRCSCEGARVVEKEKKREFGDTNRPRGHRQGQRGYAWHPQCRCQRPCGRASILPHTLTDKKKDDRQQTRERKKRGTKTGVHCHETEKGKSDDRNKATQDMRTRLLLLPLLLGHGLLLNLSFHSRHHDVLHLLLFSCLSDVHLFHVLRQRVTRGHNKLQWLWSTEGRQDVKTCTQRGEKERGLETNCFSLLSCQKCELKTRRFSTSPWDDLWGLLGEVDGDG